MVAGAIPGRTLVLTEGPKHIPQFEEQKESSSDETQGPTVALRTELGLRLPPTPSGAPAASGPSVKGQTRHLGTMIIYYRRQVLADGSRL